MKNSKDDPDGMPLDNLEKIQVERVNSLKRVLQNFKKDPVSKKSEPYFAKRLQQIDDINAAFEGTHNVLVCTEGYSESEYCTKGVVTSFEEKFMEAYCLIAEEQKRMFPDVTSETHMLNSTAATVKQLVQRPNQQHNLRLSWTIPLPHPIAILIQIFNVIPQQPLQ
ncbi:hypothetical protein ACLKA6_000715 [Drosophila palustris]